MAGYRRFIAYVYEYRKGKKGGNCGFVKVEVREERCSVEVHLHCEGITPQTKCRVFGFVRKDGLMNGILLGNCETQEDVVECLIETDSTNMADSGVALGKMGGMVFLTETGGFFGTEWDDQPIRPDNFKEIPTSEMQGKQEAFLQVEANKRNKESNWKTRNGESIEEHTAEGEKGTADKDNVDKKDAERGTADKDNVDKKDAERGTADKDNVDKKDIERSTTDKENAEKGTEDKGNADKEDMGKGTVDKGYADRGDSGKRNEGKNNAGKDSTDKTPMDSKTKYNEIIKDNKKNNSISFNPQVETQSVEKNQVSITPGQKRNPAQFRRLPFGEEFMPFDDGEFLRSWKIRLEDLRYFPMRNRSLHSNRFLQHGYYNFGHILLAHKPGGQFILGVPGGYDQQERFMANMFGFPWFKASCEIELPRNKGGYWYRLIDAPNLN